MASPFNLAGFTTEELTAMHAVVKATILGLPSGRLVNGSSAGQNFQVEHLTTAELWELNNALTAALGFINNEEPEMGFARPVFNRRY